MKAKTLTMSLLLFFVIFLEQSSSFSIDWLCIPGERVGPITAETSISTLKEIFGEKNIRTLDVSSEELDTGPKILTYIFPDDKNELRIQWKDETFKNPWVVAFNNKGTQWKTPEGITIGSSLEEVMRINKKDFILTGFGWEYGGWVKSWNDGELGKKYKNKLSVFFDEGNGTIKGVEYIGDKRNLKSSDENLIKAELKVNSVQCVF